LALYSAIAFSYSSLASWAWASHSYKQNLNIHADTSNHLGSLIYLPPPSISAQQSLQYLWHQHRDFLTWSHLGVD
jgi:hypothetical protein